MSPLLEYREDLFREIEFAAQEHDAKSVLAASRKLETLESLIGLNDEERQERHPPLRESAPPAAHESAKARGHRRRTEFVRNLESHGIPLEPIGPKQRTVVFRTPKGIRVGIAYAREGVERNKGRWFLGLPETQFDHAVLLCESADGASLSFFSLPKDTLDRTGSLLTCKDGQVKFNVFRREGEAFLDLPRHEAVNIEAFRDTINNIR